MKFVFNPFTSNLDITASDASDISGGTANTVAGFDSTGILESIPNWNIDPAWGGLFIDIAVTPSTNPNQTDVINRFATTITPSVDLTQYNFVSLENFTALVGPEDFSVVTGFNNSLQYDGDGEAGQILLENNLMTLGDGTSTSISNNSFMSAGSVRIRDQHTANGLQMLSNILQVDLGSTTQNLMGYNQNIILDGAPSNGISGMTLGLVSNIALPTGYNGLLQSIQINDSIQSVSGYIFDCTISAGLVANSVQAFQDNSNIQSGASIDGGYQSYNVSTNLQAGATVDGYVGLNINPNIAADMTVFEYTGVGVSGQLSGPMAGIKMFGASASLSSGTILTSNYYGFVETTNAQTGSSMNTYFSASLTPTLSSGSTISDYRGVVVSPSIGTPVLSAQMISTAANGVGPVQDLTGVDINLSGITATNRKVGLAINDGIINAGASVTTQSSIIVDSINLIVPQLHVESGSPITGTTVFGHNFANIYDIQDDIDAGGLGRSAVSVAFVANSTVVAGKTMDSLSLAVAGAQLQGDGTIGTIVMYDAIGSILGADTPIVTNQYMFRGASVSPGIPTNSWGISIEDTDAENYFKKSLAIDTATKKVSNASIGFEIGGTTKALRLPVLTTTERNALTALEGMEVFNTTTNAVEFYDGTSWTTGTITGVLPIANGGTNNSTAYQAGSVIFSNGVSLTQDNAAFFYSDSLNALGIGTASPSETNGIHIVGNIRSETLDGAGGIVKSDASGVLLNGTVNLTTEVNSVLPIANGGTSSGVALNNNRIMISSAGAIVEQSALTANAPMRTNGSGLPTTGNLNLATEVTGILDEANGGTGQSTYTTGDTLYASAANTLSKLAIGSAGDVLTVAGGVPTWAVNPSAPPDSTVYMGPGNGHGSTGTAIRTFSAQSTTGTDLTYTSDSTNGDYVTVNTTGRYSLMWYDRYSGGGTNMGFSINQTTLTDDISVVADAELIFYGTTPTGGGQLSATAYLTSGDVIRFNDGGNANNTVSSNKQAIVMRIG